ncbi:MAG: peptidase S10 [Bacteroidota bacterium]
MQKITLLILLLWSVGSLYAQDSTSLSVTQHQVMVDGKPLNYSATTGYMLMNDEKGEAQAKVFFIAYTKDGVKDISQRSICYTFNGGPGSSSVWLHMGGLGPKRIKMAEDGDVLPPPYETIDNPYTWLGETDLVFIDPMMTGYTRPAGEVDKKKFLGYQEDLRLVGDFIRLYTNRYKRWASPKFLAGESYGTTRAAGLTGYLQNRHGMYLNGIVLISAVLEFGSIRDYRGNDLAPLLRFPSFVATSWFHGKLDKKYDNLEELLQEVEVFTLKEYSYALMMGDALPENEREAIIDKLHNYTGLSKAYIDQTNLRLFVGKYNKELLREEGKTVGRLDSRFKSVDYDNAGDSYEYDPSYNRVIYGPFTTAVNDHFTRTLNYENDIPYEILTGRARPWNYSNVQNRFLNVAETLRSSMTRNPYLKVWIVSGYYDLATPYFATDYVVDHMFLPADLKKNITINYYPSGHMVYIHQPSLVKLQQDFKAFIQRAKP